MTDCFYLYDDNLRKTVILEKRKIEDHHIESHVPFQKKAFDNRLSVVSESNIRIQVCYMNH